MARGRRTMKCLFFPVGSFHTERPYGKKRRRFCVGLFDIDWIL
ncbi:hypothetical protein HMPREF7215_2309 [Pyramidobacter piscolens W5455]|uniref:Uncharacterized protein n=1 Tax=Pyramidobacter piscolens W5455 TaxID=352165 RepID=A0ABP2HXC3_9BACT|nr:hypothetical protein HMPREF7215_2309 [Pyramidobacter piscolens W5455]